MPKSSMGKPSADEVAANPCRKVPPGGVVTSMVVVYEYLMPGEDSDDDRGPFLVFERDMESSSWKHLGMLEALTNDLRAMLRSENPD